MIFHCVVKGCESRTCNGTPEWNSLPIPIESISHELLYYRGGTCKLNPETCGRVKTEISIELPKGIKFIRTPKENNTSKKPNDKITKKKINIEQGHLF